MIVYVLEQDMHAQSFFIVGFANCTTSLASPPLEFH